jgi:hypothetical protein
LVSLFTRFLVQKRKSPPKQAAFHPAFHERTFLACEICTAALIIQNTTPVRCFRKRSLKSIAAPESPVARPELPPRFFCRPGVPVTPTTLSAPTSPCRPSRCSVPVARPCSAVAWPLRVLLGLHHGAASIPQHRPRVTPLKHRLVQSLATAQVCPSRIIVFL